MAEVNKKGYWKENNERQTKSLSDYKKSGGKDKIRLRTMKSDIKYSAKQNSLSAKSKALRGGKSERREDMGHPFRSRSDY